MEKIWRKFRRKFRNFLRNLRSPIASTPPECSSTLAPFWVEAGPPGPEQAPKWRAPRDHPPCRSSSSAAHPIGSLLLGKALDCAYSVAPSLCPSHGSGRSHLQVMARTTIGQVPYRPDKSRLYPSHGTGSVHLGGLDGIQRETA